MIVKINGCEEKIEDAVTIASLIERKDLRPDRIVVEHNRSIVAKESWADVTLSENDSLEIVCFVGGG